MLGNRSQQILKFGGSVRMFLKSICLLSVSDHDCFRFHHRNSNGKGRGDSEFTWQALAGFGYKFNKWDFILVWRYLSWEFEDSSALDNMDINGPLVGAKFIF
jgi:hypothetical protein